MNEEEVLALMKSSQTEDEWNDNCRAVKRAHGGDYPPYWYSAVVQSGVTRETAAKWGGDDQIRIRKAP